MKVRFAPDDYVIIGQQKSETKRVMLLAKVTTTHGDSETFRAAVEDLPHLRDTVAKFKAKDVIVNFGRKPEAGKVYGFDLAKIYLGKRPHDDFNEFHFFTRVGKDIGDKLYKSADRVAKKLSKNGLSFLFGAPCVYEVVPKSTKYSGMYIPARAKQNLPARIQISVGQETLDTASLASYEYVLAHEIGHLVHLMFLRKQIGLNAKWINKYSTTIKPKIVTPAQHKALLHELPSHEEDGIKGLLASLEDDDDKVNLKLILKWMRETKGIDLREVDTLIRDGHSSKDVLQEIWPTIPVQSKKLSPLVTEYACKNYKELFAESFAFFLLGHQLPKSIESLMERSLQAAIQSKDLVGDTEEADD